MELPKYKLIFLVTIAALHHTPTTMAETISATNEWVVPRSSCEEPIEEEISDLDNLRARIRKSKAVGPLTKLKLRGEIKALLKKLELYHSGKGHSNINQLNERFDLLYMKVVSLVQEKDPDLHRQLCNSWEPLRRSLQSPSYFSRT